MSLLSNLFKGKPKTPSYEGIKPYTSPLEAVGGPEYYGELKNRLAGRNVGFGEGYADKYSSPIIQNMRNQFTGYQIPELNSELSATGRRKGSSGFQQIARAYSDQGDKEGDVFSRLQQRNEDQMRNEINDALTGIGNFNKDDVTQRNSASDFNFKEYNQTNDNRNADYAANQATAMRLGQGAVQLGMIPFTGDASLTSPYTQGYGKSGLNTQARLAQRVAMGNRRA